MSLDELRKVQQRKIGPKICVACKSFRAECHAPIGEDSAALCWLCAHHVVDHEAALHEAATAQCECTPDQVYPAWVMHERRERAAAQAAIGFKPVHPRLLKA